MASPLSDRFVKQLLELGMNHSLDDVIEFECGCKVSIDDFYDLIDKVKTENSDHTTGWHLTENHLELENTDRQDVCAALALILSRQQSASKSIFQTISLN